MRITPSREAHRRALLLIDFQEDFLNPNGRMPACRALVRPVLAAAAKAVEEARCAGDMIMAIGNEFRPGDHLMNLLRRNAAIAGSRGARWTTALPLDELNYLPKWAGSAFINPDLDLWLRNNQVRTIALSGLMAKACITATARDAMARGYDVELIEDAITCFSETTRLRALSRLEAAGARRRRSDVPGSIRGQSNSASTPASPGPLPRSTVAA